MSPKTTRQPRPPKHSLASLTAPISDLKPYPGNPRRGNVAMIKESLEQNGQYRPIVVNSRNNQVLAGNHTLLAAKELDWDEISVSYVDADEDLAKRIVLVDNRSNDMAGYDEGALAELLGELDDLSGTGYEQDDLDALLADIEAQPEPSGEDDPPPLPAKPKTKPGDIYILGRHRLICADARNQAAYQRLLGKERIDLLWTDPPYGVEYEGKTVEALQIQNDGPADLAEMLASSLAAADFFLKRGARLYICHPSGEKSLPFIEAFLARGWRLHQQLVWVKDSLVLGHCDYHYRHESILYGHKPGSRRTGRGHSGWFGDDSRTSVLEVERPKASKQHPTMKPPELIEIALRNSTRHSHLVLDPFAGSGSTLAACEQLGRASRLIELDPRYCDVIVARFEALTGESAIRERT